MSWEWLFPLLGGVGIGSLLNTALQAYLKKKNTFILGVFQEKKKAYIELLASIGDVASSDNKQSKMRAAVAIERIALVGSPEVYRLASRLRNTAPGSPERNEMQDKMVEEMRKDLKLDARALR